MNPQKNSEQTLERAVAAHRQGQLPAAADLYARVLAAEPGHLQALQMSGLLQVQLGNHQAALALFDAALQITPRRAGLNFNRALALLQLGRAQDALAAFNITIEIDPQHAKAHATRAATLHGLGLTSQAIAAYAKGVAALPDDADLHQQHGNLLYAAGRYQDALQSFERAISIAPRNTDALANLGCAFLKLGQPEQALRMLEESIEINASFADAHFNRGIALAQLGRHDDAIASFSLAIRIAPDFSDALRRRGATLALRRRFAEAVADLEQALALQPRNAPAWLDLANTLADTGHHGEAITAYEQALAIDAKLTYAFDSLLQTRMKVCDWHNFSENLARLEAGIGRGIQCSPTRLLALSDSAALQKRCAEVYAAEKFPAQPLLPLPQTRPKDDSGKIHVGYFTSDLFAHATAFLMAGMFEQHNRQRFHCIAFSWGAPPPDKMHERLAQAFDEFIDVEHLSDRDVVILARRKRIDIAVDLKGLTQHARPGIFALRAAPLQVSYLGYPCTMGMKQMDYLIADATLIEEGDRQHYTEKILYLPGSYQVNDSRREIAGVAPSRADLGLPAEGFVFCCFNNAYKITPVVFDVWMRLLVRVQSSVLWLFETNTLATQNLRKEAKSRGVDPARLVFAPHLELSAHLARHREADLFLDTLPCNAHTTASDALWAGLPVVTCIGHSFAGRVAASLLHALGLQELVTRSLTDYEELAFSLAMDKPRLDVIRETLAIRRSSSSLFDTALFTRRLEAAYELVVERSRAGLAAAYVGFDQATGAVVNLPVIPEA